MRNEWYGDKRDIVKWSVLIDLAKSEGIKTIFQIVMFRPDGIETENHQILSDGITTGVINEKAYQHFRHVHDIQRLAKSTGLNIVVHDKIFENRDAYFDHVTLELSSRRDEWIVFLDPDTGIEPKNPDLTHVKKAELKRVYDALQSGDILVVYQHSFRDKAWVEISKDRFAGAIGIEKKSVSSVNCFSFVNDVTFLIAKKPV